jgi:hypothetical protein
MFEPREAASSQAYWYEDLLLLALSRGFSINQLLVRVISFFHNTQDLRLLQERQDLKAVSYVF